MNQTIFGRQQELSILERLLSSNKAEFLAIYGRRRVGKTYLIHEYFKDKGIYFYATGSVNSTKQLQIRKFFRELQNQFPEATNLKEPADWDEALYALKEMALKIPLNKKIIIFLDELPWLASKRFGFLPALEYIWNQYFANMPNIILVVCGSAANWIIKKIINNKEGLYGRLSEVIKLNAFTLAEAEKFLLANHINLTRKQVVELYMALGGIAKYLTYVRSGESAAQVINRLCFNPQGQLVGEFNNLYHSLFDKAETHIQIVKELSTKRSGLIQNELIEKLKLPLGGHTSSIFEELEECGFIAKSPEFHKKNKERRLWLSDEYSYFYLVWMESIKGSIVLGSDREYWLKMPSDAKWKSWSGYAFESICFKHIAQIKKALGIGAVLTTESQWSYKGKDKSEKGAQIDLIIDRKDDCINLCEIKFYQGPFTITAEYASELRGKIALFREHTKTTKAIFLTLNTPYGLNKNEHSLELVNSELTLEDLFVF